MKKNYDFTNDGIWKGNCNYKQYVEENSLDMASIVLDGLGDVMSDIEAGVATYLDKVIAFLFLPTLNTLLAIFSVTSFMELVCANLAKDAFGVITSMLWISLIVVLFWVFRNDQRH